MCQVTMFAPTQVKYTGPCHHLCERTNGAREGEEGNVKDATGSAVEGRTSKRGEEGQTQSRIHTSDGKARGEGGHEWGRTKKQESHDSYKEMEEQQDGGRPYRDKSGPFLHVLAISLAN